MKHERPKETERTDVLIVGSGCAGLYCALHLPQHLSVTVITKETVDRSDSFLAQGGMCALLSPSDFDSFFGDTMRAGHYENDPSSVRRMIGHSPQVVRDLLSYGVRFQRRADGRLACTREGGHSRPRILFHKDITGREIMERLLIEVRQRKNIIVREHTKMIDLRMIKNCCIGAVVCDGETNADVRMICAENTVLATGGVGGLYRHSTNFRGLTGDAVAIALCRGIATRDLNYVQIHPTTLYEPDRHERNFLISESVRGEGAVLLDAFGQRFANELLPRDRLTEAIRRQMKKDGTDHVYLDLRPIPERERLAHFPNIVEYCEKKGYDVGKEPIPVVPAQHYFMGGIRVDQSGRTSAEGLYAVGETACTGVHGRNRLASNSLLEALVFAGLAAEAIAREPRRRYLPAMPADTASYRDIPALERRYRARMKEALKEGEDVSYDGQSRVFM